MRIQNQAKPDNTTYLDGRPTQEERYYNTFNLDLLLGEMQEVKGTNAVVDFLKEKLKYYKAIQKEGK